MKNKLTKQYHKGTLPFGFYYFKNSVGETYTVEYGNHGIKGCKDVEVLEEVPTYIEYENLMKICKSSEEDNKKLYDKCKFENSILKDLQKGNEKLKKRLDRLEENLKGVRKISKRDLIIKVIASSIGRIIKGFLYTGGAIIAIKWFL